MPEAAHDFGAEHACAARAPRPAQQLAVQPRQVLAGEGDGDGVRKIGMAMPGKRKP